MNEREKFEESYKNLFGEFPKCVFFDDGCYKLIRAAEGVDIFNGTKMMINASWLMWCSSANRDGYKLVPKSFIADIHDIALDGKYLRETDQSQEKFTEIHELCKEVMINDH